MQTDNQKHLNFLIDRIYDIVEPGQPKIINKITDTQLKEAVDEVVQEGGTLEQTTDYGREYDIPGNGYFIHLLNLPLVDYNIVEAIVMSAVLGAVGFVIFALINM